MEQNIIMENDMEILGEVVIGADEEVNELRLQMRDLRNAIAIARLQLREKDQEIQNLRAENEQLTVEKDTEVIFWFGAFNQEKNRADGLQLEKDQEIQNLRVENEQLTAEKNSEENFKYYWFGAFNREKNRADGLQLEKDQAGFGLAVQVAAPSTPVPTTPTPSPLASGPASGPSSGSSGPSSGPASGPSSGLASGPSSGPVSGPSSGPAFGPTSGPASGPFSGPASGPSSGPASGPSSWPASGPSSGPASGSCSGPASGPSSGLSGPASSLPRPVNSFHEALQCWNNWNGRDERVAGIDLKGYLFHPDNGRYVPQIVQRAPTNVRQLFFIKNRGRASLRVLNEQYKNEMNRTGLLRELQFIRNSQENQAAKGMVQIRD
ncbi:unnamed protein product [Caenorhabditis nigoni]